MGRPHETRNQKRGCGRHVGRPPHSRVLGDGPEVGFDDGGETVGDGAGG